MQMQMQMQTQHNVGGLRTCSPAFTYYEIRIDMHAWDGMYLRCVRNARTHAGMHAGASAETHCHLL